MRCSSPTAYHATYALYCEVSSNATRTEYANRDAGVDLACVKFKPTKSLESLEYVEE